MSSELRVDKIIPTDGAPTGGGGGIVQVKYVESSTYQSFTSTSYIDVTNMSLSFTPKFSTSRILVLADVRVLTIETGSGGTDAAMVLAIVKDGTVIQTGETRFKAYNSGYRGCFQSSLQTFDVAGTTNAITFKLQCKSVAGTNVKEINPSNAAQNDVSTFTVMAVSA